MTKQIRLNAFAMNCVAHQSPGLWTHPRDRTLGYNRLPYWLDLAKTLERGRFDGLFLAELGRRVGYKTESQNPGSGAALRAYLVEDLQPAFAALDFSTRLIESPSGRGPYLLADYREDAALPTVLT